MSARWARVKDLFLRGLDVPEPSRAAWLAGQCEDDADARREVEALWHAQTACAPILSASGSGVLSRLLEDDIQPEDYAGRRVGAYRIVRLIGEGGMGRVFLAERDGGDFSQRVALKSIRPEFSSADTRARFLREREILASLNHPHIAQLHDGGVAADGTPYFTLEYIEGEPLTRYCDAHRLDVRARLGLIAQVCGAIAYAHRNLVVHRDLKPSNILVTDEGVVKLLDFGIAKLLEDGPGAGLTGSHAGVMTREYAAPEQVLGDAITTATDVYALGVLTYELVSGHLPYARAEAGRVSFAKAIVEDAPEPLHLALLRATGEETGARSAEAIAAQRASTQATLRRQLRGDLDRVVRHALEKTPEARYATVGALADDLRAVVNGRPILGSTTGYRVRKFVRRHWLPLGAVATALLAVLLGTIVTTNATRERAHAAERALRDAQTTAAVKDFLLGLFAGADPRANGGKQVSVRDLLDKGAARIDSDLGRQPAQRAELKGALGGIYSRLGLYPQAIALESDALAALDAAGDQQKLAANTELELATAVRSSGDSDRAKKLLDETVTRYEALASPPLAEQVHALYMRAFVSISAHKFDAALADAARAEKIARAHPDLPALLGNALHAKASAKWGTHEYKEAEVELKEAIERHTAAGPDAVMALGADRQTLALIYRETARYGEAIELNEQVLANARAVMGDRHPYVAQLNAQIASDLVDVGRFAEAERRARAALAVQTELLAADNPYLADTQSVLGGALLQQHRYAEASSAFIAARDIWVKHYGPRYSNALSLDTSIALTEALRGDLAGAERDVRDVLAAHVELHDEDVAYDRAVLGEIERRQGKVDAALADEQVAPDKNASDPWTIATRERYLGYALADAGRLDESEAQLRAAIAFYDGLVAGGDHPGAASTRLTLARVMARRPAEHKAAVALAEQAAQQRERLFGADDTATRDARAQAASLRAGKTAPDNLAMTDF